MSYKFTLPFPPSLNMMYPSAKNGRRYLSKRGKDFKDKAGWIVKSQRPSFIKGDIEVDIKLYRPRRSGDTDNFIKPTLDCLEGVCFENDSQVKKIIIERFEDKNNPRVEVTLVKILP